MTYAESRRITRPWVDEMLRKTAEYEARLVANVDDATPAAGGGQAAAEQAQRNPKRALATGEATPI